MLRIKRVTGVALLSALLIGSACSSSSSDNGGDSGASAGGKSGAPNSQGGSAGKGRAGASTGAAAGKGGEAGEISQGGEGGEGGEAATCPGCDSGFCLKDGTCVDCLPDNDHCPSGQYCTAANQCAQGCKNNQTSCASGVCGDDHNCKHCIGDSECASGFLCGDGECAAACGVAEEGTSVGCGDGLTCCSEHCSNLLVDSKNCGGCGKSCNAGQFCGLTACGSAGAEGGGSAASRACVECHETTLANVCTVSRVTVILDTNKNSSDGNRVPGRAIGAALRSSCVPQPELTEAEQDSVEALNITTGRPVSNSSELLVVAGGPFYQNLEGYLEEQRIAPLYWKVNGDVTEFRRSKTDAVVLSLPIAGDHDSHDLFIVQFMRDPISGSLALNVQGFWLSGTVAAAYQVINGTLPVLEQQDQAWYAYEWTDLDGDKAPDLNEIHLLDSGK